MTESLDRSRRQLIRSAAALALGSAFAGSWARAATSAPLADLPKGPRYLELLNTHTSEVVSIAYHDGRHFVATAMAKLEHLLRDHRAKEQHSIDPQLYDQLAQVAHRLGREPRFEVISGYRSPKTNATLADAGRGVAKRSLHMTGQAIDIRLRGIGCDAVRDTAIAMQCGGVGYYGKSRFVHLDTGRIRRWG